MQIIIILHTILLITFNSFSLNLGIVYKRHVTIKHLKNTFSLPTSTLNNSYTICDNINNVNNTIVKTPEPLELFCALDTAYSHDITKTNYNQQPSRKS